MARKPEAEAGAEAGAPEPTANADALADMADTADAHAPPSAMEGRVVPTGNAASPQQPLSTYSSE